MSPIEPLDAEIAPDEALLLTWSDGVRMRYPMPELRAHCTCATCVDEWTGEVRVAPSMFPDVRLKELEEVGNYAFKITFSDGHDTGIFTFEALRRYGEAMH